MEKILQHFREDEQPFVIQAKEWIADVALRYTPKLTAFLDPRQIAIITSLVGHNGDVKIQTSGGFIEAERQRVLLYPDYFEPEKNDFELVVYELRYPAKFLQLKHGDVLGALMATGLDRGKFGDIRIDGEKIQFVIQKEFASFIMVNLESIHKAKVHLMKVTEEAHYLLPQDQWTEQYDTVSSLRLDTVIASVYKISRQKASQLIQAGKVKVNHQQQEQGTMELEEQDLISIRGFGRSMIRSIEGRTKKDKIRIVFGKLERKR